MSISTEKPHKTVTYTEWSVVQDRSGNTIYDTWSSSDIICGCEIVNILASDNMFIVLTLRNVFIQCFQKNSCMFEIGKKKIRIFQFFHRISILKYMWPKNIFLNNLPSTLFASYLCLISLLDCSRGINLWSEEHHTLASIYKISQVKEKENQHFI